MDQTFSPWVLCIVVIVKTHENLAKELWILKFSWRSIVVLGKLMRKWSKGNWWRWLYLLLKKTIYFWNVGFAPSIRLLLVRSFLITNSTQFSSSEQHLSTFNLHKNYSVCFVSFKIDFWISTTKDVQYV